MNIGGKIKKLRESRGLSMRVLGELVGVTHSHISKIESGENSPSVKLLEKIADYFDVDITYFFISERDLDGFTEEERELFMERDLSINTLKEKYNLIVDGKPASDKEIEEMIKYIRFLRHSEEGS